MSGLETAIRNALERSDRSNAEIRARIYQSARQALENGLQKQQIEDPEVISVQRQRLEAVIRAIEMEERAALKERAQTPVVSLGEVKARGDRVERAPEAPAPAAPRSEPAPKPEEARLHRRMAGSALCVPNATVRRRLSERRRTREE